jgi:hypothetical protein
MIPSQEIMHDPRFSRLDALLAAHAWLWRPQPFREARPEWCGLLPELARELMALDDGEVTCLEQDGMALGRLLARHVPALAQLEALTRLPERVSATPSEAAPHVQWEIPGRKWAQIEAFAHAVGEARGPLLEWCGGKGHLGRLLALRRGAVVDTLELDAGLCADGARLAGRAGAEQKFFTQDAFSAHAAALLPGRHVVALHACGDLHRSLVRRGIAAGVTALDIAPCCYYHMADKLYRPWSAAARLELTRDDLRLAVTETVTAPPRETRLRERERAWKLGFDRLRRELTGEDRYISFKPTPKQWLNLGFRGFCAALATRQGLVLPAHVDWERLENEGRARLGEVKRLSLPRHVFRRPLEVWLVLDLASYLVENDYRVEVGTFCPRAVTPRNILLSARL